MLAVSPPARAQPRRLSHYSVQRLARRHSDREPHSSPSLTSWGPALLTSDVVRAVGTAATKRIGSTTVVCGASRMGEHRYTGKHINVLINSEDFMGGILGAFVSLKGGADETANRGICGSRYRT